MRLLDRVAAGRQAEGPPRSVLDLGAGTGLLALTAAERWTEAAIAGVDASEAMLSLARVRAARRWPRRPDRIAWLLADASTLPLADASVDLVISSFMLQLVPDRGAVLGEVRRVLRPGGWFGLVTWLADESTLPADLEFDEAVLDLDLEEADGSPDAVDPDQGEYPDLEAARTELEACGLEVVDARREELEHAWQRDAYARFKEGFDEWDLVASLTPADLHRLRLRVAERWARLPDDAFVLKAPLVSVIARRPG
jgi:SAM-dependent methyltransferase